MEDSPIEQSHRERWLIALLFFVTCASLIAGLWLWRGYLLREMERLEPWQAVAIWVGDIISLLWFIWFFAAHAVLGQPLERPRGAGLGAAWWLAMATLAAGLVCDGLVTLILMNEQRLAYERAVVVDGVAESVATKQFPANLRFTLQCRFQDQDGVLHHAEYSLREQKDKGFPPDLPQELINHLRQGVVPFPVKIAYDPGRPARHWLAGAGWNDADALHYFSALVLLFQAIVVSGFVWEMMKVANREGHLPWWYNLHKVFPLVVEAGVFVWFGMLQFIVQ
ncbi:MAG: hypothetical protein AB7K24_00840 [Gemmataceae bacterium]